MAEGCYNAENAYLPASWRGMSFTCETADSDHGRRGAEGEFPFSESTAWADLGRRIRKYNLRGRFERNNHTAQARAFVALCEMPGPGILVHPVQGVINAACLSCRVSDSPLKEAGVTYIDLEFVEAGDFLSGFLFSNPLVALGINAFITAVSGSFTQKYRPATTRWYDAKAVVSTMNSAVVQLQNGYLRASADETSQSKWQTVRDFRSITQDDFALNDPDTAATVVHNAFETIDGAVLGSDKADIMRQIINWATQSSSFEGEAGEAQNAVYSLIRLVAAAYLARSFTETQPATVDEGLRQYDMVMAVLDQEAEIANTDCYDTALFLAIREFSTAVARVLLSRAYESPTLVVYQFPGTMHSLVAAYQIFGDAKRVRSLENRNPGAPWEMGPRVIAESVT